MAAEEEKQPEGKTAESDKPLEKILDKKRFSVKEVWLICSTVIISVSSLILLVVNKNKDIEFALSKNKENIDNLLKKEDELEQLYYQTKGELTVKNTEIEALKNTDLQLEFDLKNHKH